MDNLEEQVFKRVCAILDIPCYAARKEKFVLKICEHIVAGNCVVIDSANKAICSLHPHKQDV